MTSCAHMQNIAILATALGLAVLWNTGWPFLLLAFWLSPSNDEDTDELV